MGDSSGMGRREPHRSFLVLSVRGHHQLVTVTLGTGTVNAHRSPTNGLELSETRRLVRSREGRTETASLRADAG